MRLNEITNTDINIEITGITADSREVKKGFLFGSLNDDKFITDAIENGAVAVVVNHNCEIDVPNNIVVLRTDNPAKKFALIAAKYYGKQPENIAAVTGTNGKTSIADFVRQILTMMNYKAASNGTLGLIKGNLPPIPSPNTTPVSAVLQRELKEITDEGYNHLVVEASSHGLCQYRLGGVKVNVAGFTNLTRDHLDYHLNMENYLEAKLILFRENLVDNGVAVLNADIDVFERIKNACGNKKIITYGKNGNDIKLLKSTPSVNGQKLDIVYYGKQLSLNIPLAGEFQAMNVLCALGIVAELTKKPDEAIKYVTKIIGAKGRLELVKQTSNGAAIYVDYAHTPDALENVLKALRPHTTNKLKVVFGCGGNRDAGKRPIMGKIANDLADVVYITDDNPRFEDPAPIREQIISSCPKGINIPDRAIAIETAITELESGDVLVIAGKGHETGQYVMGKVLPFSDHEEILKH
ncbi:MAG: UDP-N-acetylmuramoyl-L-alanyl-D-glutamate--2,6-diaminopimelate ligase [Alphaproteobacteria bacterium]|nr:UDP-N-acetylmuramoyl-L-alanyl-D-glutamate--2,6-diaminopimelate ligase [Alphaproteobacteria bacterium]